MKKVLFTVIISIVVLSLNAQPIITGAPFLTITPDSRGSGMGDNGVATSPDVASIFYNSAKYPFMEKKAGLMVSYSPWLKGLASDMQVNYLSGFYKINNLQSFQTSLKYFYIGEIIFTNNNGEEIFRGKATEFAFTGGYSLKMNDYWAAALNLKFIYSNLTAGANTGSQTHPGIAAAGDLSFYYRKDISLGKLPSTISWGLTMQNMGTKIDYGSSFRPFIPTNLKTGFALNMNFDEFNSLQLSFEMNKLMVPTQDSTMNLAEYYSIPVTEGMIRSFYDSPGGFSEEMQEIIWSGGAEYGYNNMLFLRSGLFLENANKGGRKFISVGLGFKYSVFDIDFSYLIPFGITDSPLKNTMRFTLSFYFDKNNNK